MRQVPIHKSGTQYNLFLGCDRELIMSAGLIAFTLVFGALTFYTIVGGIVIWSFCLYVLRKLAQYDPLARHIYLRHITYKSRYPARATPFSTPTRTIHTQPYKKKKV